MTTPSAVSSASVPERRAITLASYSPSGAWRGAYTLGLTLSQLRLSSPGSSPGSLSLRNPLSSSERDLAPRRQMMRVGDRHGERVGGVAAGDLRSGKQPRDHRVDL